MKEREFNMLLHHANFNLDGVYFVGDPHGQIEDIPKTLLRLQADAVVFLGDFFDKGFNTQALEALRGLFEAIQANNIQLRYILGNHDHPSIEAAEFFEDEYPHLNLNAKVEVLGKHGLRVAGLGGVFRGRVWYPRETNETPAFNNQAELLAQTPRNERIKGGLPLKQRSTLMPDDYYQLWEQQADVLVTHEAPRYMESGFVALDELVNQMGVKLLVHGHHHIDQIALSADDKTAVRSLAIAQVWNWHPSHEYISHEVDLAFAIADKNKSGKLN